MLNLQIVLYFGATNSNVKKLKQGNNKLYIVQDFCEAADGFRLMQKHCSG